MKKLLVIAMIVLFSGSVVFGVSNYTFAPKDQHSLSTQEPQKKETSKKSKDKKTETKKEGNCESSSAENGNCCKSSCGENKK